MLRYVHVRHYGCLRDVRVDLGPLTVLVGPNASGKSTLLRSMIDQNPAGHPWRGDRSTAGSVTMESLRGERVWVNPQSHALLHPSLQQMRLPNQLARAGRLAANAGNLHNVVFALGREGGASYARRLCQLVPDYSDVDLEAT